MRRFRAAIFLTILGFAHVAAAQELLAPITRGDPPPPLAPEVIARDDEGQATVRAIKLASPSASTASSTRRFTVARSRSAASSR